MSSLSDLITRNYGPFRGVDFSNNDVLLSRSPNALNMWKNYQESECIETRPGMKLLNTFNGPIYGLFFYTIQNYTHVLVHVGTKMYEWDNYPNIPATTTELYTGLNPKESRSFVYDNVFFFMDGINYLEYDGRLMKKVEGTIPFTSYYKNPDGSTTIDEDTDTDLVYQPVNVLTSLRKNMFIGDGKSIRYQLDAKGLDPTSTYLMRANVGGQEQTENIHFTVNRVAGVVTFSNAPTKDSEVIITYSKTTQGYKNRILNCNLSVEFDNRIFFSGNKDYPNAVFHCELNDPRYVRDTAYYECGVDLALIKAIVPGDNVLWVFKEIHQNSSSVYYMTPTLDSTYGKIYPSVNGSVSLGCVSTGINFNDDIVYFSKRGLEGINGSLYSEQLISHRSSNVDSKMVYETDYTKVKLSEYNGYLLCLIDSKVYLADSRQKYQDNAGKIQYEWYYWELPFEISFIKEYRQSLYLGNKNGELFILEGTKDNEQEIKSFWTTAKDDFGASGYTKTTNKRGNVADLKVLNNDDIHVDTIVDGILKEKKVFNDSKGYIAYRIKDKKFKDIQLKFSSNKPFGLFSCTLQGFIAGYIKR